MSGPSSARPLHFAAFVIDATGNPSRPSWRRSLPRQADFDDLERSVRLARTLERGLFDAVFFADSAGHQARWTRDEHGHREADLQAPGDPSVLAGAIAYVTSHLGIAFTASILQEDPFNFARRISTLDHVSKGRIAWNIADDPPGDWTEEYADVTYKLWEGSWEEDALGRDGRSGRTGRTGRPGREGKVHPINHRGPRYQVAGPHLVSPSPQRTPLLFRAASEEADRAFAARNAEAIFLQSPDPAAAAAEAADIRSRASSHGRLPGDIKFFQGLQVGQVVGRPQRVADELASWRDAGVDGINLVSSGNSGNSGNSGSYEEFVDHVAPLLQARGLMQREYAEGSLRHKLFGRGDRLPEGHPAARYRGAFATAADDATRLEDSVYA
jgi:alkanesulfonate monooxygenase SsuD/methylene tetrahydromethanopterin reductase-like flavin-dependent oxidoreductase (luciferase family)